MNERHFHEHPSAEAIQALLDGALPSGERAAVEEHLASCARCSAEMDGWRSLFERIGDLPTLTPGPEFAERVLAGVEIAEPRSWAARIRASLRAAVRSGHPDEDRLQEYADGLLPAWQAARVRAHVEGCDRCGSRAAEWGTVLGALNGLDRFAPSEQFAARVMAEVRVPAAAPAKQRVPEWRRALAPLGRVVPRTRKAWAAISGVALTPAVTLGLVLWTVFTHPTLTPGALVSFVLWKAGDLAALAWNAVSAQAMASTEVFGLFSFFQSLSLSPAALGGVFLAFSAAAVAAAWVLYTNLVNTRSAGDNHAHVSIS